MELQSDWIALLRELSAEGARFIVIGAVALAYHGEVRATRDFDVWVDSNPENAERVFRALAKWGAPMVGLITVEDLQSDDLIFQIGREPLRIDIITNIEGVTFSDAWASRETAVIGDLRFAVISRSDLIKNKKAAGREKDLLDVRTLERLAGDEIARRTPKGH